MNLYVTIFLICINFYGFIIMYIDKKRAKKHQWRVPEARLFAIAACFGSLGILTGMYLFRHKTKHWKFIVFIPALLVFNIYLIIMFLSLMGGI